MAEKKKSGVKKETQSTEDRASDVSGNPGMKESPGGENWTLCAFDFATTGVALTAPDGSLLRINKAFADMLGYSIEELNHANFVEITHPEDREASRDRVRSLIAGERETYRMDKRYIHKNGDAVWADVSTTLIRNDKGDPQYFITSIVNIADRKLAEEQIGELNRTLLVISGINRAIAHLREPLELFREACRIAVELGGLRMAWIGLADDAGRVEVVASDGVTDGYIEKLNIVLGDEKRGRGPTGAAISDGRNVICNNVELDGRMEPWREDALRIGYRSSAAFPLKVFGEVRGSLNLYSGKPGFFDDEEIKLLNELAADLSFAMEYAEQEARRQRAEEALRRNEQMLRLYIEHSPAAIAMFDREMNYIAASRRFLVDYDLGGQDIIGRSHYELFPEMPERWREIHRRCLAGAVERAEEDSFARTDGRTDFVRWEIHPWRETEDEIGGIILFSEVITERKLLDEAVREKERLLSESQRIAHIGSWEINIETGRITWSDEMYNIYGISPDVFKHDVEAFLKLLHLDDRSAMEEWIADCYAGKKTGDLEFRIIQPGGETRWINGRGEMLFDNENKPCRFIGTAQDITEKKQILDNLKTALAEKDTLMREVQHRVKNNLAAIIGMIDIQRRATVNPETGGALAEFAGRIKSMSLIHDRLYHSGLISRIDFRDYIRELTTYLRAANGPTDVVIRHNIAEAGVLMDIDIAIPCGMIVNELVMNAMKYAFPGGRPRSGAGVCEITVSVERAGDVYTLAVADNGAGLPAEVDLETTKSVGLRLVRMIGQHQLGGKIEVDRAGGTRFVLTFSHNSRS